MDSHIEIRQEYLEPDILLELAEQSGWNRMTQDGLKDNKRRAFVLAPQPIVVIKRDEQGHILGVRGGINFGAYAFMQYMMVPIQYQGQGIGTELLKEFQQELLKQNGGETSIATLAHPESRQYYLNRGFIPLQNALVLKRGTEIKPLKS
jgi:GNAT superfamily N-acetyltransferase